MVKLPRLFKGELVCTLWKAPIMALPKIDDIAQVWVIHGVLQ